MSVLKRMLFAADTNRSINDPLNKSLLIKDNDYLIVKFDFTVIRNIVKCKRSHAENQLCMSCYYYVPNRAKLFYLNKLEY